MMHRIDEVLDAWVEGLPPMGRLAVLLAQVAVMLCVVAALLVLIGLHLEGLWGELP